MPALITGVRSLLHSVRERLFKGLFRARFRYDVFISYSHRDAREYAANLKDQLAQLDFSCFIDKEESPPGSSLDPTLARALKKSAVLVLLATERALTRPYIVSEFAKFAATERTIVPINILGALTKDDEAVLSKSPWSLINERKIVWIDETDEAFTKQKPSPQIADGIDKLFKYTRRNTRVRTEIVGTAVLALLAAVGAGFVIKGQAKEVSKQAALALVARQETATQQGMAFAAKIEADLQLTMADVATREANRLNQVAADAKKEADRQQEIARTASAEADKQQRLADAARLEAERQLDRSRNLRYVSDITLAQRAAEAGDMDRVADLLEAHLPDAGKSGQPDLRGFEWYHLWLNGRPRLSELTHVVGERAFSIACAPNNRLLAVGRDKRMIEVWDLVDRKLVTVIKNETDPDSLKNWIEVLTFSPDGKTLVFATFDTVKFWDVATQKITSTFEVRDGRTGSLAISPDGRILAIGSENKVQLFDIGSQKLIAPLEGIEHIFRRTARFSPDGRVLVVTQPGGNLDLWEVATRTKIGTLHGLKYDPEVIAFSPDGKLMATCSAADKVVRLWDFEHQKELFTLNDHGACLAFSPGGDMLAVCRHGEVRLLDPHDLSVLAILPKFELETLAFTPDGKTLAGTDYFDVALWDVTTQREQATLRAPGYPVDQLAYHPDGQTLSILDAREGISLWNLAARRELARVPTETASVAFSQDGRYAAIANSATVSLRDGVTLKELAIFPGGGQPAFSPDGSRLLVSDEGKLTVWDTATRGRLREIKTDHKGTLWLAPDNRTLAIESVGGTLYLFDLKTEKDLAGFDNQDRASLAFSPDGRILASAAFNGLTLFDVVKKKEIIKLRVLTRTEAVAFSPDGRTLASASEKTVTLWDTSNYQEMMTLSGFTLTVTALAFSPDGKVLATASYDGKVRFWFTAGAQDVKAKRRTPIDFEGTKVKTRQPSR